MAGLFTFFGFKTFRDIRSAGETKTQEFVIIAQAEAKRIADAATKEVHDKLAESDERNPIVAYATELRRRRDRAIVASQLIELHRPTTPVQVGHLDVRFPPSQQSGLNEREVELLFEIAGGLDIDDAYFADICAVIVQGRLVRAPLDVNERFRKLMVAVALGRSQYTDASVLKRYNALLAAGFLSRSESPAVPELRNLITEENVPTQLRIAAVEFVRLTLDRGAASALNACASGKNSELRTASLVALNELDPSSEELKKWIGDFSSGKARAEGDFRIANEVVRAGGQSAYDTVIASIMDGYRLYGPNLTSLRFSKHNSSMPIVAELLTDPGSDFLTGLFRHVAGKGDDRELACLVQALTIERGGDDHGYVAAVHAYLVAGSAIKLTGGTIHGPSGNLPPRNLLTATHSRDAVLIVVAKPSYFSMHFDSGGFPSTTDTTAEMLLTTWGSGPERGVSLVSSWNGLEKMRFALVPSQQTPLGE